MDFTRICRICLEIHKQTYDIFTCYYVKGNMLYSEMLSNCTKLQPCVGDGLPTLICKECSRQLKKTYAFNIRCEANDRTLRRYLDNDNKPDLNNIEFGDSSDIKHENNEHEAIKSEDVPLVDEKEDKYLVALLEKNKDDVKLEVKYSEGEDSSWDAEDNDILQEMKLKKLTEELDYGEEKPKKKRGRKKRVFEEGETPPRPESKMPHQCDICGKFLSTKSNLTAHKICHTEHRPYQCNACPAAFRGYSALFHHKKVHTGETPYHCEYCPKQFSRRTGLVNHIRIHTGEKRYSCEICFKSFVQSAQLSIHMKRHKGDKSYLCQECGKGFAIKSDLKVHQRIHNGEKPYPCHLCTKKFATSGNLNIHIRIHNKVIRYNCKECQRGFVTCSAYRVHLKRHKGQRDYHCECGKTFYTSSALKQHKVVHTGEKKYQCKICDRKFSQSSHLSRHFKRDHAKPNEPVPSSDHYKLVLRNDGCKQVFGLPQERKDQSQTNAGVKCEGT